LKLKSDKSISSFAFKFNLRRYTTAAALLQAGWNLAAFDHGTHAVKVASNAAVQAELAVLDKAYKGLEAESVANQAKLAAIKAAQGGVPGTADDE
jgi:hypothetical protein